MDKKFKFVLNKKYCKTCGICYTLCPKNVLGSDKSGRPKVVNADACVLCRLCEYRCPDFAIRMLEED